MTFQAKTPSENLWHFDGVIYYRLFKDVHQYNARKKEVVYKSWTTLHKTLKWSVTVVIIKTHKLHSNQNFRYEVTRIFVFFLLSRFNILCISCDFYNNILCFVSTDLFLNVLHTATLDCLSHMC